MLIPLFAVSCGIPFVDHIRAEWSIYLSMFLCTYVLHDNYIFLFFLASGVIGAPCILRLRPPQRGGPMLYCRQHQQALHGPRA